MINENADDHNHNKSQASRIHLTIHHNHKILTSQVIMHKLISNNDTDLLIIIVLNPQLTIMISQAIVYQL